MSYKGSAIMGGATAQLAQMEAMVSRVNPDAPTLSQLYLQSGQRLGVRGDLALAQAIHETDYFRFTGVVQPEQNNFAGLGATGPENPGHSFATAEEGVLAHLQHLYAYASTEPMPADMALVDPRFDLVERGSAPFMGDLNGKWAVPGTMYGQSIDRILGEMLAEPAPGEPYQITRSYIDEGSQNRPGPCGSSYCWEGVRGIVVHRTASSTMDAYAIRRYFNEAPDGRFASSQYVLDDDVILQLMPVGEVAFHTAGKNTAYLGIETCEHNWGGPTWPETYRKLVWLTAYLVRAYHLSIHDVTGHFWWDPVNRPYDPTHMGWRPSMGKSTGVFDWNQFIADVQANMTPDPIPAPTPTPGPSPDSTPIPVRLRRVVEEECAGGLLINSTTYVPIRSYTSCVAPNATVEWEPEGPSVVVTLPE